jgi:putative membrane protein
MLKTAIVVLALMLTGTAAHAAAPPFERSFVRYEAQVSYYELAIAKLARTHATRPAVRTYAETLINDHEAYNEALRELATAKGIAFPSAMRDSDRKRLDGLVRLRGRAFDTAFVREARRVNGEDLISFRRGALRAVDPDVRRFVARFLTVEERHETEARALSEGDVAARGPVIAPPHTDDKTRIDTPR